MEITITNIFATIQRIMICLSGAVTDAGEREGIWKNPASYVLGIVQSDGTLKEIPLDESTISYTNEIPAVILHTDIPEGTPLQLSFTFPGRDTKVFDFFVGQVSTPTPTPTPTPSDGGIDPETLEDIRDAAQTVRDLSSYPFPTTEATPVQPTAGGPASLGRMVDGALKTALGRLPKSGDTRSFVNALNQSFKLSQVEGHTLVEWTPHALSGTTDLGGGVTGAQASLVAFGRNALSASLPLLDGLYSLLPDADPQEVAATQSIVHSQWTDAVELFELEGGPTDSRVDEVFNSLEAQVAHLGELLGMVDSSGSITRRNVITPDEEGNLTSFIAFKNYVQFVRQYYNKYSEDRTSNEDLGTGLTLLGRALSVVGEQVAETYASMDSVYIGPAERQVILLQLDDNGTTTTMTVEELMSWVDTFSTEEAPRLIQDGGLRGVQAIEPTAQKLTDLTDQFAQMAGDPDSGLPVALRQRRVRNTLNELVKYLAAVETQIDHLVPDLGIDLRAKDSIETLKQEFALLQERLHRIDGNGSAKHGSPASTP